MANDNKQNKSSMRWKAIIRALHHRNFRYFFAGQSISLIGTWMQRLALSWLVYRLTNSALLLGVVGFASQIPVLILSPFAGVLADRWDRHRTVIITQVLAMVQALLLAVLVLTDKIVVWEVIALSIFLGIINALDMPARQSFLIEMVEDKKDLGNAIALNSSMVNGARLVGPSVGGLIIAAVGEGMCFLINGLSYLAVILSLLLMKIKAKDIKPRQTKVWEEFRHGLSYVSGFMPIKAILLLLALLGLVGMPYTVLMPVFAKDILHGGADTMGFLMGATGIGALLGAVYLAAKKNVLGLGRLIAIAACVFGLGLALFSFSHITALSLCLMVLIGLGQMIQMAGSNTLIQTLVDDDKRGRVMSLYTAAFMGLTPVGSLLAGFVAGKIGAPWTVFISGTICVAGAIAFAYRLPALRKVVRPIYANMGIIPPVDIEMQNTPESLLSDKYNSK